MPMRGASARVLEDVGQKDTRVVPALKQALQDEDEGVRLYAKSALQGIERLAR
jgi:HEAT repeat protein